MLEVLEYMKPSSNDFWNDRRHAAGDEKAIKYRLNSDDYKALCTKTSHRLLKSLGMIIAYATVLKRPSDPVLEKRKQKMGGAYRSTCWCSAASSRFSVSTLSEMSCC